MHKYFLDQSDKLSSQGISIQQRTVRKGLTSNLLRFLFSNFVLFIIVLTLLFKYSSLQTSYEEIAVIDIGEIIWLNRLSVVCINVLPFLSFCVMFSNFLRSSHFKMLVFSWSIPGILELLVLSIFWRSYRAGFLRRTAPSLR